ELIDSKVLSIIYQTNKLDGIGIGGIIDENYPTEILLINQDSLKIRQDYTPTASSDSGAVAQDLTFSFYRF
ncbi:hypothetical protein JYU23_01570, partial [bacterium AH-315-C07]|nr:hypothetical protein [bacterium AH-315-C07]